jgi:DNA modification methylase
MKEIPDGSVDLIVTSPPYAKQRSYTGYSVSEYGSFLHPILNLCKDKLKETGSLILNIKENCKDGQRELYVYKLIIEMVENYGWRLVDEYIWNKTNPFPTGSKKRLKDAYERVLHFSKSKSYKFYPEKVLVKSDSKWLASEKRRKNNGEHNTNNGSGMNMSKRISSDTVRPSNVITGSSSNANIGHPAVYPLYLPEFFIKLMTESNDVVLDPFMGSGTTGAAAKNLNRNFIGIELDQDYFNIAKERINNA